MRLSIQLHFTLLLSLLCLTGCELQTPWSREYHLRQYEELRTLGDRARVKGTTSTANEYYQNSLEELQQISAKPAVLAQAYQDIAETDLITNNTQDAAAKYKTAIQLYNSKKLGPVDKLGLARCLSGYGIALLNENKIDQSLKLFEEARQLSDELKEVWPKNSKISQDLACGWIPELCEHSDRYWIAVCDERKGHKDTAREQFQQLLNDPLACKPSKLLAAKSLCQILHANHEDHKVKKIEDSLEILHDVDSAEAELVQQRFTTATARAKVFEAQGNPEQAKAKYIEAVKILRESKIDSPTRMVCGLCNLAFFYLNNGISAPSLPLLEECLAIQKNHYGANESFQKQDQASGLYEFL